MSNLLIGFAKKNVFIIPLALLIAFLYGGVTSHVYADQKSGSVADQETESVEIDSDYGTFLVGAKGWFALWDSAVLDWFEKDISANFKEMGLNLESDIDT